MESISKYPDTNLFGLKQLRTLDSKTIATFAFLLTAALLGGGGSRFPMQEMLVYLSALPALYLAFSKNNAPLQDARLRYAKWFIIAIISIVVIQLIPLPPFIWQSLPGREVLAEAATIIGAANEWRPLSIDSAHTISASLYIIVPFTAFLAVMTLHAEDQTSLIWCLFAAAIAHIMISLGQTLSGGESFYMYQTTHKGLPIGIFANRNHIALFLLLSIILLPSAFAPRLSSAPIVKLMLFWCTAIVFTIAIIATNSRAVTVLLLLTLTFLAIISLPTQHRRKGMMAIIMAVMAASALIWAAWQSNNLGSLQGLSDRFQQEEDYRYEFWPETLTTAAHYFPIGSGIGTFDEAFRSQESLDIVGTHFVNHAHNDYVELVIENGVIGLALIAAIFTILLPAIRSAVRNHNLQKAPDLPLLASWAIAMIALHSMVDYPLRSLAIAALAGTIAAISMRALGESHGTLAQNSP